MGSISSLASAFGAWITAAIHGTGYRMELFLSAVLRLPHVFKRWTLILDQFWVGGIKVLHVVILVGFSIGMVVSLQTGLELSRFGQQDQIGSLVAISMAREMGPFITATIIAAAVGSGIAAEIGTMSVSEELAALEVLSIDRASFLVMPRVLGLAILCPVLTIVCDALGRARLDHPGHHLELRDDVVLLQRLTRRPGTTPWQTTS